MNKNNNSFVNFFKKCKFVANTSFMKIVMGILKRTDHEMLGVDSCPNIFTWESLTNDSQNSCILSIIYTLRRCTIFFIVPMFLFSILSVHTIIDERLLCFANKMQVLSHFH